MTEADFAISHRSFLAQFSWERFVLHIKINHAIMQLSLPLLRLIRRLNALLCHKNKFVFIRHILHAQPILH